MFTAPKHKYTKLTESSHQQVKTQNIPASIAKFIEKVKNHPDWYRKELKSILSNYCCEKKILCNPAILEAHRLLEDYSISKKSANFEMQRVSSSLESLIVFSMILIQIDHEFTRKFLQQFFPESFQHNSELSQFFSVLPDQLRHGKLSRELVDIFNRTLKEIANEALQKGNGKLPLAKDIAEYGARHFAKLYDSYSKAIFPDAISSFQSFCF